MSEADNQNPYGAPRNPDGTMGSTQGAAAAPAPAAPNPYAAPKAQVARESEGAGPGELIEGGRKVGSGRGAAWLGEGFTLFKQAPGVWIGITIIFFVMFIAMAIIPVLGNLAVNLLMPVFAAGLLIGCHDLENGDPLEVGHLFAGFKQNTGQLVLVGLLYLLAIVVIFVAIAVVALIGGMGAAFSGARGSNVGIGVAIGILLLALIGLALIVPLAMAVWYAPALIVFHEQDPVGAMKQSFAGCLKNILPFLVYSIVGFLLAIIATIPFGLGWLVLWPVFIGSLYKSYRDIFCVGGGPD